MLQVRVRQDVGFSQDDRLSFSPGEEFAEGSQHVVLLGGPRDFSALFRDDKWNGVHPETRDSQLQPETHDLEDLCLDVRIGGVEVRLKVIEAMKVICLRRLVIAPC
jgi:hypothetical protein